MKYFVPAVALLFLIAAFYFTGIRHASVRIVWKVIDKIDDRGAARAALPAGIKIIPDIAYLGGGHPGHLLDVYHPEDGGSMLPVVIYFHGGGFIGGDKSHTRQYCMALAKEGYVVVNANYRLSPAFTHPAQIEDVMAVLAWAAGNAASFGGDQNKTVLAGDSAGAYLAGLAACLSANEDMEAGLGITSPFKAGEIKGVLLFSGLYDLAAAAKRKYPGIRSDIEIFLGTADIQSYENLGFLSVTGNITEKFPPAFLSSGEVDGLYPESVELAAVLSAKNIYHETLFFDKKERKAFHVYQKQLNLHTAQQCMDRVVRFLSRVVN